MGVPVRKALGTAWVIVDSPSSGPGGPPPPGDHIGTERYWAGEVRERLFGPFYRKTAWSTDRRDAIRLFSMDDAMAVARRLFPNRTVALRRWFIRSDGPARSDQNPSL